jgi:hypothetical protein
MPRLIALAFAGSLILWLALIAAWVRSYDTSDRISVSDGQAEAGILSMCGEVGWFKLQPPAQKAAHGLLHHSWPPRALPKPSGWERAGIRSFNQSVLLYVGDVSARERGVVVSYWVLVAVSAVATLVLARWWWGSKKLLARCKCVYAPAADMISGLLPTAARSVERRFQEPAVTANPPEIPYQAPQPSKREIVIERFADGGVTVTIPQRRTLSLRNELIQFGIALVVVFGIVFGILWLVGTRPWRFPWLMLGFLQQMLGFLQQRPGDATVISLFFFMQLVVAALIFMPRRRWVDEPAIIGISRRFVVVQEPGLVFRRQFQVKRRALRNIEIVRWERTMKKSARLISVKLESHAAVWLCEGRTEREINIVAEALREAQAATTPAPEGQPHVVD